MERGFILGFSFFFEEGRDGRLFVARFFFLWRRRIRRKFWVFGGSPFRVSYKMVFIGGH